MLVCSNNCSTKGRKVLFCNINTIQRKGGGVLVCINNSSYQGGRVLVCSNNSSTNEGGC